jgi:3-oxoacyl-[acyl-carrier protein] reductase
MDLGLAGKVVAVTGGSRGIGRAVADALAAEGVRLAIAARGADDLAAAHSGLEQAGALCLAYACDLAAPGETAAFLAETITVYGRLDGLVCAAGAAGAARAALVPRSDWEEPLGLALFHALEAMQAAAVELGRAGGKVVLFGPAGEAAAKLAPDDLDVRSLPLEERGTPLATAVVIALSPRSRSTPA